MPTTYTDLEKSLSNLTPEEVIAKIEQEFAQTMERAIQSSLTTSGGEVTGLTDSGGRIVKDAINQFVNSDTYREGMTQLLSNINGIAGTKFSLYKDAGFEIQPGTVTDAQVLATNQFIDAMNEDGLNARFNQTLRTAIYDSVTQGLSQQDMLNKIREQMIKTTGQSVIGSHITQVVQMAADSYSKAIDQQIMDKYSDQITHIRVVGSLIDTSSPQCRQAVEKYDREIPIDKLGEWIDFAIDNGANENLSAKNLPTFGGHYACRHQWLPIVKK